MDTCRNEKGFTLLSMLVTLGILVILLPLLTVLLNSADYSSNYNDLSVQQFFHFVQDDLISATDYKVRNDEVFLEFPEDKSVAIKRHGNVIHRQVDGRGHEVYLRDVTDFKVSLLSYGLLVKVSLLEGHDYEKTIVFYE